MGRAGLNRKTALATATLTLAAEAADLDVLSRFGGSAFGLNHHRGFTHSFLGVPLVAAVVVGFIYLLWRLRGRKTRNPNLAPRWGLLFAYACLAGLSHILLDFTNNYGVRPFWPFSERWISWDIVFIVEPVLLIVLTLGLILPALFSLINEEIGARNKGPGAKPAGRLAAILALLDTLDLTPLLGGITAPSLVIGGEHDRVFPPEHSRVIADAIPNARLVIVPNTGHGLLFECGEQVIELIRG